MDNLTRSQLKMILSGLHREREALRNELLEEGVEFLFTVDEYRDLVDLQDKIIGTLERMPY